MKLDARLRSLEEAAWHRRQPPPGTMSHPDSELMSLFTADRPSARIIMDLVGWEECAGRGTPGAAATFSRLLGVVTARIERMQAQGWPKDGLGDDPPEAHEPGPPDRPGRWSRPDATRREDAA